LNTQVLGISVDHIPCLQAWAESVGGINYPLLSDFWPHGEVASKYGVLRSEGYSERAIFILDKEGIIRYIDIHDINQQPSNEDLYNEILRIDPTARYISPDPVINIDLPHGGIVMYCTTWCPDCKRARAWLKERSLEYIEVDITSTPGAREQVKNWNNGNMVTPTFDINGTIIIDFDEEKLNEVLRKQYFCFNLTQLLCFIN
jgi:glutaredoxin